MHPHHANALPIHAKICPDSTARFKPGQFDNRAVQNVDPAPNEQRVTVPAYAERPDRHRHDLPVMVLYHQARDRCFTATKSAVAFLQRDHVGIDLVQHGKDTFGIALPIEPDGLADVVAGEF